MEYDARADLAGSIAEAFRVIRERVAAGGEGWRRSPSKPLAIDLCCGLGGWAEGLMAEGLSVEGYLCYVSIWHIKRVQSLNGFGKRSINPVNAGFGLRQSKNPGTGGLLSRRVSLPSVHIGSPMNLKLSQSRMECRCFTNAIIRHACDRNISSPERKPITFRICMTRGDGGTLHEIKAASVIRIQSYPMPMSPLCSAN